jgi:putative membrane protein (TIGR04086 family)
MGNLSDVRWGKVLLAAIAVIVLRVVAVFLVVTIYASYLGFQARGAPDQGLIDSFVSSVSVWLTPLATVLLTFFAARWAARGAKTGKLINGLVAGALVVIIGWALAAFVFSGFSFSMLAVIESLLVLVAGWLGGRAA